MLTALLWFIGVDKIAAALMGAKLILVAACALILSWTAAQGAALWVILSIDVSVWSAVLVFTGAAFANKPTPFG